MGPINLHARLARLRTEDAGQTLIEYAGMVLLVAISSIVVLSAVGLDIAEWFNALEDALGMADPNTVDATPGTNDASAPTGVN